MTMAQWEYGEPNEQRERKVPYRPGPISGGRWVGPSMAGPVVTEENALTVPSFLAGVRLIANAVAMCEIDIYDGDPRRGKLFNDHPNYKLLNLRPNYWAPAMTVRSALNAKRLIHGNAFAEIERDPETGEIVAYWPLLSPTYTVTPWNDPEIGLFYRVQAFGGQKDLLPEEIIHLRGFSVDGFSGLNLLQYCVETLGLAKAMETHCSKVFTNGARPGAYITFPGVMGDDAYDRFKTEWNVEHQGAEKAHRMAILEGGGQIKDSEIDNNTMQMIESRMMSVEDFARVLGMPLSRLRVKNANSFTNQEDDTIDFITNSLRPLMTCDEQEYGYKLFDERYSVEHDLKKLLMVNTATRDASFTTHRNLGMANADELRSEIRKPPLPNGMGQTYWQPANQASVDPAQGKSAFPNGGIPPVGVLVPPNQDPSKPPDTSKSEADTGDSGAGLGSAAMTETLIAVVEKAASGALPISSAKAIAQASFPTLSQPQIDAMFVDINPVKVPPVAPTAPPA